MSNSCGKKGPPSEPMIPVDRPIDIDGLDVHPAAVDRVKRELADLAANFSEARRRAIQTIRHLIGFLSDEKHSVDPEQMGDLMLSLQRALRILESADSEPGSVSGRDLEVLERAVNLIRQVEFHLSEAKEEG